MWPEGRRGSKIIRRMPLVARSCRERMSLVLDAGEHSQAPGRAKRTSVIHVAAGLGEFLPLASAAVATGSLPCAGDALS